MTGILWVVWLGLMVVWFLATMLGQPDVGLTFAGLALVVAFLNVAVTLARRPR